MKSYIAILLVSVLLLIAGCSAKNQQIQEVAEEKVYADKSSDIVSASATSPDTTSEEVESVEKELEEIENADDEFLTTELESLDSELDFEI